MILVDTDIVVDILRGYPPSVDWLEASSDETVLLPGFVVMEAVDGCRNLEEQSPWGSEGGPSGCLLLGALIAALSLWLINT